MGIEQSFGEVAAKSHTQYIFQVLTDDVRALFETVMQGGGYMHFFRLLPVYFSSLRNTCIYCTLIKTLSVLNRNSLKLPSFGLTVVPHLHIIFFKWGFLLRLCLV